MRLNIQEALHSARRLIRKEPELDPLQKEARRRDLTDPKELDLETRYDLVKPYFEKARESLGHPISPSEMFFGNYFGLFDHYGPDVVARLMQDGLVNPYSDARLTKIKIQDFMKDAKEKGWKQ